MDAARDRGAAPGKRSVTGACPHDCPDQCAWIVDVDGDRAIAVRGDVHHPFTAGVLCSKLKRYPERVYHPDRILHPLRRTGAKGGGAFERVTWDVAIEDIASRLRATIDRYGGAAILPYSFAGTIGLVQRYAGSALFRHLGATGVLGDYCGAVAHAGVSQTNGNALGVLPEDLRHSRLIVLWGTNTAVTNVHLWSGPIREARARGARVVAIDPVRTRTAEHADQHYPINPGTDAALALGLMHVVIRDRLVDDDYVASHTLGFDELAVRVAAYPPDRVAAITGLAGADIVELAHALATTRPAAIRVLVGMERHTHGAEAFRAIACLPALTGAWRDLGGGLCHFTTDLFRASLNYAALNVPAHTHDPPRSIHIAQLGQALANVTDPPIASLFVYNANPVVAAPNQNLVRAGLARADLFTVVLEQFMTDTARYADYVLPATTQVEHLDLMASWGSPYLTLNRPAIAPVGEACPNSEAFRRLARALDLDKSWLYTSDEDMVRQLLASDHPYLEGIDYERLERDAWVRLNLPQDWRPHAEGAFATASGKVELRAATLDANGLDPLPAYTPAPAAPSRYPLNLVSAKTAAHALNSQYANLQNPRSRRAPALEMHPLDAAARGIGHGESVTVFNDRGEVRLAASISATTQPGVVSLPFSWWPSSMANDASANALTADGLGSLGMGSDAFDTFVDVRAG